MKEEFDVKNHEIERLYGLVNDLKKQNIGIHDSDLSNVKSKWQSVTKQFQVLRTSPKGKEKFLSDRELVCTFILILLISTSFNA